VRADEASILSHYIYYSGIYYYRLNKQKKNPRTRSSLRPHDSMYIDKKA